MMLGHLGFSHELLASCPILESIRTEQYYYWISSLSILSSGGSDTRRLGDCLDRGIASLSACMMSTEEASQGRTAGKNDENTEYGKRMACNNPFEFQVGFIKLEIRYRKLLGDLKETLESFFQFVVSLDIADQSSNYNTRAISDLGHAVRQLSVEYAALRRYASIWLVSQSSSSCMDIDTQSQQLILQYETLSTFLGMMIDAFFPREQV